MIIFSRFMPRFGGSMSLCGNSGIGILGISESDSSSQACREHRGNLAKSLFQKIGKVMKGPVL